METLIITIGLWIVVILVGLKAVDQWKAGR